MPLNAHLTLLTAMRKNMILLLLWIGLTNFSEHKFYVSVTQVLYQKTSKTLTVTSRIFIDDLEKALQKKHSVKLYLDTPKQHPQAETYIKDYFLENFFITLNKKTIPLLYEKIIVENDVLIITFKTKTIQKIKTMQLKNTLLFDTFSEQQNIIQLQTDTQTKSFLCQTDNDTFVIVGG